MFRLLRILIFLSAVSVFCAESDAYEDADYSDEDFSPRVYARGPKSNAMCKKVLQYLKTHFGKNCHENELLPFCKSEDKSRRDLYRVILSLRAEKHNVIHEGDSKSFKLIAGEWRLREGCYKQELWRSLQCSSLQRTTAADVVMTLSDKGYTPTFNIVWTVRMLRGFLDIDVWKRTDAFDRRKSIWKIAFKEGQVRAKAYYTQLLGLEVSKEDISYVDQCLSFYNNIVKPPFIKMVGNLTQYLSESPYGRTIGDVEDFLQKESPDPVDVWVGIREVISCGYGHCLDYRKGSFYWLFQEKSADVEQEKSLWEEVCFQVFDRVSIGEEVSWEEILFSLYKYQHFDVKPQDVVSILDILMMLGNIPESSFSDREFWDNWVRVNEGAIAVDSLSEPVALRIRALRAIEEEGLLASIKEKNDVDIISIVRNALSGGKRVRLVRKRKTSDHPTPKKRVRKHAQEQEMFYAQQDEDKSCDNPSNSSMVEGTSGSTDFAEGQSSIEASSGRKPLNREERQAKILEKITHNKHTGVMVYAEELLRSFYGKEATPANVLEDVLALIYAGHDIKRSGSLYWMPRHGAPKVLSRGKKMFVELMKQPDFARLDFLEKVLRLYASGHKDQEMSDLAVYVAQMSTPNFQQKIAVTALSSQKTRRLIALKNKLFEEGYVRPRIEYKKMFPQCGVVRADDVDIVQNSLQLYPKGQEFLQAAKCSGASHYLLKNEDVVLAYLEGHREEACKEEVLKAEIIKGFKQKQFNTSVQRDLYQAIILLRWRDKKNIVYDCHARTFTLLPGVRKTAPGCYQKAFWHRLCDAYGRRPILDVYLELSNDGLDPEWSKIADICELHKLCFGLILPQNREKFKIKQRLWKDIVCDEKMHEFSYYEAFTTGEISRDNMYSLKRCWALYQTLVLPQSKHHDALPPLATEIKLFLKNNPEGVTLKAIENTLMKDDESVCDVGVIWRHILRLMWCGYAGNVNCDFEQIKVFWDPLGLPPGEQTTNLMKALSEMPKDYSRDMAAFTLYKKGHNSLPPEETFQLMDIMTIAGRLPVHFGSDGVVRVWESVLGSFEDISDVPSHMRAVIERTLSLQRMGMLRRISDGENIASADIFNRVDEENAQCESLDMMAMNAFPSYIEEFSFQPYDTFQGFYDETMDCVKIH